MTEFYLQLRIVLYCSKNHATQTHLEMIDFQKLEG